MMKHALLVVLLAACGGDAADDAVVTKFRWGGGLCPASNDFTCSGTVTISGTTFTMTADPLGDESPAVRTGVLTAAEAETLRVLASEQDPDGPEHVGAGANCPEDFSSTGVTIDFGAAGVKHFYWVCDSGSFSDLDNELSAVRDDLRNCTASARIGLFTGCP